MKFFSRDKYFDFGPSYFFMIQNIIVKNILVMGTENAIEKDPNASLKHSPWLYSTGFCSLFARVGLALGSRENAR